MQGDKESACLQYVRDNINSASFPEMNADEKEEFIKVLNFAGPNSDANAFPDFVTNDGYIEVFEINGSKEIRGGSKQRIEEFKFDAKSSKEPYEIPERDSLNKGLVYSEKREMNPPEYTRTYFIRSFNKHFEKHITSARKYKACAGIRVFLIENTGATFKVLHEGQYQGELYRPSYDKELLSYLMAYDTELTHIIFKSAQIIEVISLKKLKEIQSKIENGISFELGNYHNVRLRLFC